MIPVMTLFWLALQAPTPPPDLTPEALAHNDRGIALVLAGQLDEGVAELERAYAALPDPLLHRAGRGKILGSLRSALVQHYTSTSDPVHLCRLRDLLQRHRTDLLTALGTAGSLDDVAGTDTVIRDVDAKLAGRSCEPPPAPPPTAASAAAPPPAPPRLLASTPPPPLHPPGPPPRRPGRLGLVLLGIGGAAMIGSAVAAGFYGDRYRRIDALDRRLADPAQLTGLYAEARHARTAAIVTGSVAGAFILAGVAALVTSSRRAKRVSLTPALTPTTWTLHVRGNF